jgi:hypothetical protein
VDSGIGPALAKLPERCVSREPTSGRLVVVHRGRQGFQYINGERSPEAYNRALGLSYEQVEAMEYGALFGFDAELADPGQSPRAAAPDQGGFAGRHRQLRALVPGSPGARTQALRQRLFSSSTCR